MLYTTHIPAQPVGEFVERFWMCSDKPLHSRERILPSGTIELVINLSDDEVRIYDPVHLDQYGRFPGAVVSGTYTSAFVIDPSQHASMMGVHFKPGGAFRFLGEVVGELADTHIALEELWGPPAAELRERLCAASTPQERFSLIEEVLAGANLDYVTLTSANTSNLIQSNGHIAGLDLTAGEALTVRNYHGAAAPEVVIDQHLAMDATGTLRLVFDADPWDSTISFAPAIPVTRGGTLELALLERWRQPRIGECLPGSCRETRRLAARRCHRCCGYRWKSDSFGCPGYAHPLRHGCDIATTSLVGTPKTDPFDDTALAFQVLIPFLRMRRGAV